MTKLALVTVVAAAAPPAVDLPPIGVDLPPVAGVDLPPVEVDPPPVPRPAVPTPTPVPVPVPPVTGGDQPPAGGGTTDGASARTSTAGGSTATGADVPARDERVDGPRRAAGADERKGGTRRRSEAAAAASAPGEPKGEAKTRLVVADRGPAAEPRSSSRTGERRAPLAGVIDVVEDIPNAILWALGGIAALALALAGVAFSHSRRRAALETQREELLGDIGLLSGALLPPVPAELHGLAITAAYRPADGPAAGGDFYDVFCLGDGRVGILLGDVSGHGRDSVGQAALARYTLRTLLAAGHAPGTALAHADRLLARDLPPHFVTVVAAIYEDGVLTYAKAGHSPPIVLGTDHDPAAELPACPLGLGLGTEWPEFQLQIGPGVAVCLYTDGLEDARRGTGRLGRDHVAALLADEPDAERLLAAVHHAADVLTDDTAAVVLRGRATALAIGT